MLALYDLAVKLGYQKKTTKFFYKRKRKSWVPIVVDKDYLEYVNNQIKHVVVIYLIDISQQPEGLGSEASENEHLQVETTEEQEGERNANLFGDFGHIDADMFGDFGEVHVDLTGDSNIDKFMDVDVVDKGYEGDNGKEFDVEVQNTAYVSSGDESKDELEDDEDMAEEVSGNNVEDEKFREIDFKQSEEDDNKFEGFVITKDLNEDQHKELREELTDEYDTYDLRSVHGEESYEVRGKTRRRAPKFKQYNRNYDLRKPKFTLGLEFSTMKECRESMRYYATSCARPLRFLKNELHRLRVKCEGESEDGFCPWMFYASHIGGGPTVRVKTLVPNHTCGIVETSRFATSSC
ncbi:PREDICTED: Transposase MuDR plant [Prunus dulcis]|uniref:PREDICTED: Transposase MuDR plant n=1 Tax=Prunus dulcis TaxID=3755 RepID=A0A5E4FKD4_PRUDU|nr:PREDICTED: Transposase MuDR plant [Prunus dulcis]